MELGSLIRYQGKRWQITSVSDGHFHAQAWDGSTVDLGEDEPDVEVVCHPPTEWPFLVAPQKMNAGPMRELRRNLKLDSIELTPLVDWVPSSWVRSGGSIFVNPRLRLRQRETLTVVYQRGARSRLTVTRAFGTVASRKHRIESADASEVQPRDHGRRTAYDLVLQDQFEDPDE